MAITAAQELPNNVRDPRSADQKITAALTTTPATLIALALMAATAVIAPWSIHFLLPWGVIWWASVASNRKRQMLPYSLPKRARRTDYRIPKDGMQSGFKQAEGIMFMGNAMDRYYEVWESASQATTHHLVFGTTGSGKSEFLSGLYANFILLGSGVFFSDAKGTTEQVSKLWQLARRFGRDIDFFNVYYGTGGVTVRDGRRDRLSHRVNPCSFASTDQINNMFLSFLPKSSGENQFFQDRAITMFTALTPALVDLRDLRGEPLNIPKIRHYLGSLHNLLELALDVNKVLENRSREILIAYLRSLTGFDWEAYQASRTGGAKYDIPGEAWKSFGQSQNYFTRALASLADTYGHIYNCEVGEVDYLDALLNRRIVVISLPSLQKAGAELNSLAKINLANIRGAIAFLTGDKVEGLRSEILDNSLSKSEVPTGLILDEYGYQATEGMGVLMAQARSLGISVTIAGQDLSNLEMGGKEESEQIFGNAMLFALYVRNVKDLAEKLRDVVGEADIATESGLERRSGLVSGFIKQENIAVQRRTRITGSDLAAQPTGKGFMFPGRGVPPIHYYPFAPLPDKAPETVINRFAPILWENIDLPARVQFAGKMNDFVRARAEGRLPPPRDSDALSANLGGILQAARAIDASPGEAMRRAVLDALLNARPAPAPKVAPALASAPLHTAAPAPAAGSAGPQPQRVSRPLARARGPGAEDAIDEPRRTRAAASQVLDADEDAARLAPSALGSPARGSTPPAEAEQGAHARAYAQDLAKRAAQARRAPEALDRPANSAPQAQVPPAPVSAFGPQGLPQDEGLEAWSHPSVDKYPEHMPRPQRVDPDPLDGHRINAEIDQETEDDETGDVQDPQVLELVEGVGADMDAADRAFDPDARAAGARITNVKARQRDLSAAIQEASRYHPPPIAPTSAIPPARVKMVVDRIIEDSVRRRRDRSPPGE